MAWNWEGAAANYAAQQQALGFPNINTVYGNQPQQPTNPMQQQQWNMMTQQQQWQHQQQWQQWQQQFQQWQAQYGDKYQEAMQASGIQHGMPGAGQMANVSGAIGGQWTHPDPPPPLPDEKPNPPPPPDDSDRPPPPPLDYPQEKPFQKNMSPQRGGRGGQNRGGQNRGRGQNRGGGPNRGGGNIPSRNENLQQNQNQFSSFQGQMSDSAGFQSSSKRSQDGDSYLGDGKRSRQDDFGSGRGFAHRGGNNQDSDRGRGGKALRGSRGARGGRGRGSNFQHQQPNEDYQQPMQSKEYDDEQPWLNADDYLDGSSQQGQGSNKSWNEQYQQGHGSNDSYQSGLGSQFNQQETRNQPFQQGVPGNNNKRDQQKKFSNQNFQQAPKPLMEQAIMAPMSVPAVESASTGSPSTKPEPDELSQAEKEFDAQFEKWEQQFNTWKDQNKNHPDKSQYNEYEAKWESWREQLLSRREGMRKKREGASADSKSVPSQPGQVANVTPNTNEPTQSGRFNQGKPSGQFGGPLNQPQGWQDKNNQSKPGQFRGSQNDSTNTGWQNKNTQGKPGGPQSEPQLKGWQDRNTQAKLGSQFGQNKPSGPDMKQSHWQQEKDSKNNSVGQKGGDKDNQQQWQQEQEKINVRWQQEQDKNKSQHAQMWQQQDTNQPSKWQQEKVKTENVPVTNNKQVPPSGASPSNTKLGIRNLGATSKWDKPEVEQPQIKSIAETLKTLFPNKSDNKTSPNDPMLITLGDTEEQSGLVKKSSDGIPGLDLVATEGATVEKLPDNALPPTLDLKKLITTPDTDKPFMETKTGEIANKPVNDGKKKEDYPWHEDNFFDDVPTGEIEQDACADQDDRDIPQEREEWPQEHEDQWQHGNFRDQDDRQAASGYEEEQPFQKSGMPPRGHNFDGDGPNRFPSRSGEFGNRDFGNRFGGMGPQGSGTDDFGPYGSDGMHRDVDSRFRGEFGSQRSGMEPPFYGKQGVSPLGGHEFRSQSQAPKSLLGHDFRRPEEELKQGDAPFPSRRPPVGKFPEDYDENPYLTERERFDERDDYYAGMDEYSQEYPEQYNEGDEEFYQNKEYSSYNQGRGSNFPRGRGFFARDEVERGRGFDQGRGRGRGLTRDEGRGGRFNRDNDDYPPGRNFPIEERDLGGRGRAIRRPGQGLPAEREIGLDKKKAEWNSGLPAEEEAWPAEESARSGRLDKELPGVGESLARGLPAAERNRMLPGPSSRLPPSASTSRLTERERSPYMSARSEARGNWGWDDARDRDFYAPMKPPPMMMWGDDAVEFKPATVVDYGHQATLLAAPVTAKPVVPKEETFQEPVQTFDYGHGQPATAVSSAFRSTEREPDPWSRGRRTVWGDDVDDRRRGGTWDRDDRRRGWEDRGRGGRQWDEDDRKNDRRPDRGFGDDKSSRDKPRESKPKKEPPRSFSPPPDAPPPPSMEPAPECTQVEDLLCLPGRVARPPRIAIYMRGPPGSGKSFVAKLIKDKELENGGNAPRILCLDDYFMTEADKECEDPETGRRFIKKMMVYEYEPEMENHYRNSLSRGFKKTVDDGYFPFIILDCVNDKMSHFDELWNYAKQKGFQNFVAELEVDATTCAKRNEHGRTLQQIEEMVSSWERTPHTYPRVDLCSLLQSASINEVEMEDLSDEEGVEAIEEVGVEPVEDDSNSREASIALPSSKWEKMEKSEEKLDRLDGLRRKPREAQTMEDWLQLDDYDARPAQPGKKRVMWADLEERRQQERMRAIGFVVGQTDWSRMTDPTFGGGALTQTKYI